VVRRLRALLNDLSEALPPERRAVIEDQFERLAAAVDRSYIDPDDRAEAHQADRQGIGLSARWEGEEFEQPADGADAQRTNLVDGHAVSEQDGSDSANPIRNPIVD
jgi:hypothetical protein